MPTRSECYTKFDDLEKLNHPDKSQFDRLNHEIEILGSIFQESEESSQEVQELQELLISKILIRDRLASNKMKYDPSKQDFSLQRIQPETSLIANNIHVALMNCLKLTLFNSK